MSLAEELLADLEDDEEEQEALLAMETDEATEAPSEAKTSEPMTTADDIQVCSL